MGGIPIHGRDRSNPADLAGFVRERHRQYAHLYAFEPGLQRLDELRSQLRRYQRDSTPFLPGARDPERLAAVPPDRRGQPVGYDDNERGPRARLGDVDALRHCGGYWIGPARRFQTFEVGALSQKPGWRGHL